MLRPVERFLYRVTGVDEQQEMDWKQYAVSFVLFSFCGTLLLYGILRLQRFPALVLSRLSDHAIDAGPGDEHGHQLLHHHDLAGLRR